MYTLLYGAKKNVGDFLILDRAEKLFGHFLPDEELYRVKRWLPIDEYIDKINQSKAIILCGGPAYQKDFYPGIYPLTEKLNDIKVPIIPFGLGWFSEYADQNPNDFSFSNTSQLMIRDIHNKIAVSSTRDVYTSKVLQNHGIHNFLMTGCPAWYDLNYMNKPFKELGSVKKIVVTTAQNPVFHGQNIELINRVDDVFPDAEKFLVFHRGILADHETSKEEERNLIKLKEAGEQKGYSIVDASYDVSNIDFYHNCDLHIGYRVHAHIYFLSIRKPSFLLHEDGRGSGFSKTIGINSDFHALEEDVINKIISTVENEKEHNFSGFLGLENVFFSYFENMKQFFTAIKG